jgi:hypothetical protein
MVSTPAVTPETIPAATVASALVAPHVPPEDVVDNVIGVLVQRVEAPLIDPATGSELTVITLEAVTLPQEYTAE